MLRNNRLLCQFYIYITGAVNTTRKCLSIVLLLEKSCHTLSQTKHQCQHKNKNGQVVVISAIRLHQLYKFFLILEFKVYLFESHSTDGPLLLNVLMAFHRLCYFTGSVYQMTDAFSWQCRFKAFFLPEEPTMNLLGKFLLFTPIALVIPCILR